MNILIGDGEKKSRQFLKTLIGDSHPSITVSQASDGKEALELLFNRNFDLLIIDMDIPIINGLEVGKTLKKNPQTKSITIVFLTSSQQIEQTEKIDTKSGSIGFITKPIDGMKILSKIELFRAQKELKEINQYTQDQQEKARNKQLNIIENHLDNDKEFDTKVIYQASDILSGDSYSIFKKDDGTIFLYMVDGQGHGILPSLTVFAIASSIKQAIPNSKDLKSLTEKILESTIGILEDGEQLAFTFVKISPDRKNLEYSIGGMYPFFIKDDNQIIEMETSNIPMMNFTNEIDIKTISLKNFQGSVLFSDGIIEEYKSKISGFKPQDLLKDNSLFKIADKLISKLTLKDDITLILLESKQ
ncbi:MAG: fused response regulator/phosphatase [Campylobacterales bacterium]|nr:fused response regulator/phosphatase [Campylobacterales bacterium]